jgi:hypothetical protein
MVLLLLFPPELASFFGVRRLYIIVFDFVLVELLNYVPDIHFGSREQMNPLLENTFQKVEKLE